VVSSIIFWRLRRNDGDSISRGEVKAQLAVEPVTTSP